MFERVKLMATAAGSVFGRRGTRLPAAVAELWRDPSAQCALADGDWFGDGSMQITDAHLGLLRQARLSWDGAERGAPMLDPQRPYGRTDLLAQLAEVFGPADQEELARRHVEMYFVIARALKHGALDPGRYQPGNIDADDVRTVMRGYDGVTDDDLGWGTDGQVSVTDEHRRLLRAIEIRWPSEYECQDRLAVGEYPAAAADPKRSYGDYTFIEVDMARILGELPPVTEAPAIFEPGPELAQRLQRLHWQMLATMQVFLERADLAPGTYPLYPAA